MDADLERKIRTMCSLLAEIMLEFTDRQEICAPTNHELQLFGQQGAAEFLGISRGKLQYKIKEGKIETGRYGGKWSEEQLIEIAEKGYE